MYVVFFQRAQIENPFRGPHLQVRIDRADRQTLDAELTLVQGRVRIRERATAVRPWACPMRCRPC